MELNQSGHYKSTQHEEGPLNFFQQEGRNSGAEFISGWVEAPDSYSVTDLGLCFQSEH